MDGGIYFVTFRLCDSLPHGVLVGLRDERKMIEKARAKGTDVIADDVRLLKVRELIRRAEGCLDQGLGKAYMRDPRIAKIVSDAIRHFDGQRYRLIAWCVMPNHVHVVIRPIQGNKLSAILHSWKSFSAHRANAVLGLSSRFWQREYFDHLVRSEASLARIVRYVVQNPAKAGLRDWPWVGGEAIDFK